jgi:hypothetical protein
MVLNLPTSKDCGVKFDRATKKRRRFEELGDEDLNITGSTASHCTTCTCCRPSKQFQMKSMDMKDQSAVFRNVRWALDEDRQHPLPYASLPQTRIRHLSSLSTRTPQTSSIEVTGTVGSDLAPPLKDSEAFSRLYHQSQITPKCNRNVGFKSRNY